MIGRTLGRYRIVARLEDDGIGSIWKAEDPLLKRTLALRLLAPRPSDSPDAARRVLANARAIPTLHHSGIATVYDVGEVEGSIYVASQLIDGDLLSDRIARGPLPVAEALRIIEAAADAVSHAHERGVVHGGINARSLKIGAEGRVVFTEFGLRLAGNDDAGAIARDLRALGALLEIMLAGSRPVPAGLERIVRRALAEDSATRYATAREFLDDVQAPQRALRPWSVRMKSVRARTRWPGRLVAGVVAVLFLIGTGIAIRGRLSGTLRGWGAAPGFTSVAVLPLQNLSDDPEETAYLADGITRSLTTRLTQLLDLRVTPWQTSARYARDPRPLSKIADELNVEALLVGTFASVGGRLKCQIGIIDARSEQRVWVFNVEKDAADVFEIERQTVTHAATRLKGRLMGDEEERLGRAPARDPRAYESLLRGARLMQAEGRESEALALFEQATRIDPNLAEAFVGVRAVHSERFCQVLEGGSKNLESAEFSYRRALVLEPRLAAARTGLMRVHWERGQSEEVLKQGEEAARLGGDTLETMFARAQGYLFSGLADRAIPLLERIIQIDPANQGAPWFLVVASLWASRYAETIEAGDAYLNKFHDDPQIASLVGVSHHALGNLDRALFYYEREAGAVLAGHVESGIAVYVGTLYSEIGRPAEARDFLGRTAEPLQRKLASHPDNFRMRLALATLYAAQGDIRRARAEEALLPPEALGSELVTELAFTYAASGDFEHAAELLRGAARRGNNEFFTIISYLRPLGAMGLVSWSGYPALLRDLELLNSRLRARY